MKEYRIEIGTRGLSRFGWTYVRIDDRGTRVLARSERSYRSKKRAKAAIDALQCAGVFDATESYCVAVSLPAATFERVPAVVRLVVDGSPRRGRRTASDMADSAEARRAA